MNKFILVHKHSNQSDKNFVERYIRNVGYLSASRTDRGYLGANSSTNFLLACELVFLQ